MTSRLKIWMVIWLFALAALPFVSTFIIYQPDERHYTNAALIMREGGGWLTPQTAEGAPRFLKPILTYWGVAAGFATAGVNVLGSRLGSLLAACATLWLTYRIGRRLTGCADTAILAALILASHLQFLSAAARANPDALLCLFALLSLDGFLRLLECGADLRSAGKESSGLDSSDGHGEGRAGRLDEARNGRPEVCPTSAFWLAYGGAALAVETKGLLGAGVVLLAWAFVLVRERNVRALKRFIHWPSMLTALAVGGSWFVYIYFKHSRAALGTFYDDQVESKVGHWWAPLRGLPVYLALLAVNFLPWSLPVVERCVRQRRLTAGKLSPLSRQFIFGWTAAVVLVFSAGGYVTVRYLLPVAPLLAIWVADGLRSAAEERLIFSVGRVLKGMLMLALLADAVALWLNTEAGFSMSALAGFVMIGGMIWLLASGTWRRGWFSPAEGLGLALLLLFAVGFFAASPVALPERSEQVLAALHDHGWRGQSPVAVVGDVKLASRLRLLAGRKAAVVFVPDLRGAEKFGTIVAADQDVMTLDRQVLDRQGYKMQLAAVSAGALKPGEFWRALSGHHLWETLQEHGRKYFLLTRS